MLMFASRVQKTIPFPTDPSQTITIQKLSRKQLQAAADAREAAHFSGMRSKFGEKVVDEILLESGKSRTKKTAEEKDDAVVEVPDPLLQFDIDSLLKYGVKAWSVVDDKGAPIPVKQETLDDLDEESAEGTARDVLRLASPKLFKDFDEQEEQKNASASSGAA